MSLGYGPAALTPGTSVQFRIAKNAIAVQVRNFSRYFVGVYFGSTPPGGSSATALAPGFHDVIAPGEQPVLNVVGNYTQDAQLIPNGVIEFSGDVFLQPISVDAGLALTGIPSQNFATLTSYLSGESLPASTAAPRVVDASNQQRVVTVPMAAEIIMSGSAAITVGVLGTQSLTAGGGFPPAILAAKHAHAYLYWCEIWLGGTPAGLSTQRYVIEVFPGTAGAVPLTGFTPILVHTHEVNFGFGTITTGDAGVVRDEHFHPRQPIFTIIDWNGNANVPTDIWARIRGTVSSGTGTVFWEVNEDLDFVNIFTSPGSIGNAVRDGSNTTPPVVGGSY